MTVEANVLHRVMGGLIGALFVAGLLSLFAYARHDRERFKKLVMSFITHEVRLG